MTRPRTCGRDGCDASLAARGSSAKWCYGCAPEVRREQARRRLRRAGQALAAYNWPRRCERDGCFVSIAERPSHTKWCYDCAPEVRREQARQPYKGGAATAAERRAAPAMRQRAWYASVGREAP